MLIQESNTHLFITSSSLKRIFTSSTDYTERPTTKDDVETENWKSITTAVLQLTHNQNTICKPYMKLHISGQQFSANSSSIHFDKKTVADKNKTHYIFTANVT